MIVEQNPPKKLLFLRLGIFFLFFYFFLPKNHLFANYIGVGIFVPVKLLLGVCMQIYSFSPFGYEGSLVTVEVDLRRGIPAIDIVGLADGAVKESRERMQAAIRNSGFEFPLERVLISLSPADLKKEGAGFDLPIALSVLHEKKLHSCDGNPDCFKIKESILVMGELELSGKIRAVRGVHAAASTAVSLGIKKCIVPNANAQEAREVYGMSVFGADTLMEAFLALDNPDYFSEKNDSKMFDVCLSEDECEEIEGVLFPKVEDGYEFSEVVGQKFLVRGLQIAAAGGHNLLAIGAPGCGKTMALQKFRGLLPLLTVDESHPVTRIMSLAGQLPVSESVVRIPPFRMPHQTATIEGMCGGGVLCRPGEISLAHNGVLFLDEAAEFRSSVLQMLRVPIETGNITLSRAGRSTIFPANFQLLLAANPCPCGNFGSSSKICLCSARSVEMYWKKFSAPLLDRIDIRIPVEHVSDMIDKQSEVVSTKELRLKIAKAVSIQRKRQNVKNAKLSSAQVKELCNVSDEVNKFLVNSAERYGLSPRGVTSCLKVARTIADMEGCDDVELNHVQEAILYRKSFNNFMESCSE